MVFWLRLDTGAPEALDNGFTALEGQPAPTCEASTRTKLRYARCGDMKSHPEEGFAPDRSMLSRILIGGLAGVLGTGAMTAAMRWLHARLPDEELYPLPPREITEILADGRGGEINLRDASLAARFAFGVAAGARSPYHTFNSNPFSPASVAVGTCGSAAMRASPVAAIGLRRPLLMCGNATIGGL